MKVTLTRHAVDRYRDRVKPGLGRAVARRELEALIGLAGDSVARPPWPLPEAYEHEAGVAWLLIADGIALVLSDKRTHWCAISCTINSGISEHERERRNSRRRRRKARARRHRDKALERRRSKHRRELDAA